MLKVRNNDSLFCQTPHGLQHPHVRLSGRRSPDASSNSARDDSRRCQAHRSGTDRLPRGQSSRSLHRDRRSHQRRHHFGHQSQRTALGSARLGCHHLCGDDGQRGPGYLSGRSRSSRLKRHRSSHPERRTHHPANRSRSTGSPSGGDRPHGRGSAESLHGRYEGPDSRHSRHLERRGCGVLRDSPSYRGRS